MKPRAPTGLLLKRHYIAGWNIARVTRFMVIPPIAVDLLEKHSLVSCPRIIFIKMMIGFDVMADSNRY